MAGLLIFSYAVSDKEILDEVISMIELCFSEKVWYDVSYNGKIWWRTSVASFSSVPRILFSYPLSLEKEKLYITVSQKEIPELCHHQENLFCNFWCVILIYAKGLAKDILVVVSPFLYIDANCTPHPSRQDIGFFLVGRCCSQHFIPGGYFRFLVLLSVLFGGNRWSVFEILNPF